MEHEHTPLRSAAVLALCGLFAVLAVGLVAFGIGYQIWCKKKGKSSCGCDCSSCGGCCHTRKKKEK